MTGDAGARGEMTATTQLINVAFPVFFSKGNLRRVRMYEPARDSSVVNEYGVPSRYAATAATMGP